MSYVGCNLVIPACPESFLRRDSRQAGVTERVRFRFCGNDELRRTFVMQESIKQEKHVTCQSILPGAIISHYESS
jgi:hypothetical protein